MISILLILLLVFAVEAVTEIIVDSQISQPFRDWWKEITYPADVPRENQCVQKLLVWFDNLISCGYCTSVWVAMFFALFAPSIVSPSFFNWLIFVFALHRFANWSHVAFELFKRGRVKSYEFDVNLNTNDEELDHGATGESETA